MRSSRALLFGRIDKEEGASWRIGPRYVEDHRCAPVVINWRAPVVVPFHQARPESPAGLHRRRHVMVEAATVIALADDLVGASAGDLMSTRLRGGDALRNELERRRSGEMLENVATIEAEQDEVIRALSISCVLARQNLVPLRPLLG